MTVAVPDSARIGSVFVLVVGGSERGVLTTTAILGATEQYIQSGRQHGI